MQTFVLRSFASPKKTPTGQLLSIQKNIMSKALVTLALNKKVTYAADAADKFSIPVHPIRNDLYLICNVRSCTYFIDPLPSLNNC